MEDDTNLYWHEPVVSRDQREALNGHRGCVIWFTGLSAAGKSTIANVLDRKLLQKHVHSVVLDGDNIRHGLNASKEVLRKGHSNDFAQHFGLGFSATDREENIRRIGEVAKLFSQAGIIAITAFISPYRTDRDRVRNKLTPGEFIEVFVDTPITACEERDPNGLYKKARAGELNGFTGIDAPYESPLSPEMVLLAGEKSPDILADEVVAFLEQNKIVMCS